MGSVARNRDFNYVIDCGSITKDYWIAYGSYFCRLFGKSSWVSQSMKDKELFVFKYLFFSWYIVAVIIVKTDNKLFW